MSDEDYACVYYLATPFWKAMMEFAYICRARRSELINMKRDQLLEKGIQMSPGQNMHKNRLDSQWQKLINRAVDEGLINEKWHFRDLKAKGVSDHEGLVSGHKTLEAKKIYIRKPRKYRAQDNNRKER